MGIYPGLSGWANVIPGSHKKEEGGQSEKMRPQMPAGVLPKQGRGYEPEHAASKSWEKQGNRVSLKAFYKKPALLTP